MVTLLPYLGKIPSCKALLTWDRLVNFTKAHIEKPQLSYLGLYFPNLDQVVLDKTLSAAELERSLKIPYSLSSSRIQTIRSPRHCASV